MTSNNSEPIELIIERSSLGTRRVRTLARHAPKDDVDRIVREMPPTPTNSARDCGQSRTYSPVCDEMTPIETREK